MSASRFCLLAVALIVLGCASTEAPPGLLSVADFVPREVDVGDRLEVIGTGFPEGRAATLTFRGDLHRPGQEPVRDVEIVVPANSRSSTRIGLMLTERLHEQLCGRGDLGMHTTFRGDVVAAFAPKNAGAPPITGVVHDVVVDIAAPTVAPKVQSARAEEGQRAAEFFGLVPEDQEAGNGVVIEKVIETSRAERAGLLAGDRIVEVDGVRVRSLSDLVPVATGPSAKLLIGREQTELPLAIDVQGFRPAAPKDLAVAAGLVGVIVLLLALGSSPLSRLVSYLARRAAERVSARSKRRLSRELSERLRRRANDDEGSEGLVARVVPYVAFVGISAATAVVAFGRPLVQVDLDLGLWAVALITLSVVGKLVSGGVSEGRRWSLWAGLGGALRGFLMCLPLVAALAAVVILTGNVRLSDAVAAQGVWPWKWAAFQNPVLLLAALAALSSVAIPVRARRGSARLEAEHTTQRLDAVEWVVLLLTCQLVAILFMGGWRLPGVGGTWWLAGGALLLQVKAWALAAGALLLRWLLPVVPRAQLIDVWWRRLLPLAASVLVGTVLWTQGAKSPWLVSVEPLFGYVLFSLLLIVSGNVLMRVRAERRSPALRAHVNPWL